jgi:hypothetical protein
MYKDSINMDKIHTDITGISTSTAYKDGDCVDLLNLRYKNGALEPVMIGTTVYDFSGWDKKDKITHLYKHRGSGYENTLALTYASGGDGDTNTRVYTVAADSTFTFITGAIFAGKATGIQAIGNTVSIITQETIYYLLANRSVYDALGVLPEIPPMTADNPDVVKEGVSRGFPYKYEFTDNATYFAQELLGQMTQGLWPLAKQLYTRGGYVPNGGDPMTLEAVGPALFDAHLVRWAFRLYDGSHTKPSPPLITLPREDILGTGRASFQVLAPGRVQLDAATIALRGYALGFSFKYEAYFAKWSEIIKGIDFFLSPGVGVTAGENIRKFPEYYASYVTNLFLFESVSDNAVDNAKKESKFYYIGGIDFDNTIIPGEYKEFKFPVSSSDQDILDNIVAQDMLVDNSISNHTIGAQGSYNYNSRLHLYNTSQTLYKGFDPRMFLAPAKTYFSIYESGTPVFDGAPYPAATPPPSTYIAYNVAPVIVTTLHINGEEKKVVSYATKNQTNTRLYNPMLSYPDRRAVRMEFYEWDGTSDIYSQQWLKIGLKDSDQMADPYPAPDDPVLTINLTAHELLDLAYYVTDDLRPLAGVENGSFDFGGHPASITTADNTKIKVSELLNPFVFPNANTYTIGTGQVLALATNRAAPAEQNYGTSPLFVFATDGIWTLNVGQGEIVYATTGSPTSSEYPVSSVVCETPYGVLFIAEKGLMMVSSLGVKLLTPQMQQPSDDLTGPTALYASAGTWDGRKFNTGSYGDFVWRRVKAAYPTLTDQQVADLIINTKWTAALAGTLDTTDPGYVPPEAVKILLGSPFGGKNFVDYLKGAKVIVYNPKESEVIICDETSEEARSYVYGLGTETVYKTDSLIKIPVLNEYDSLELMGVDCVVRDFNKPSTGVQEGDLSLATTSPAVPLSVDGVTITGLKPEDVSKVWPNLTGPDYYRNIKFAQTPARPERNDDLDNFIRYRPADEYITVEIKTEADFLALCNSDPSSAFIYIDDTQIRKSLITNVYIGSFPLTTTTVLPPYFCCNLGYLYEFNISGLEGLTEIGSHFLEDTYLSISTVDIPSTVRKIGNAFMKGCDSFHGTINFSPLTRIITPDELWRKVSFLTRSLRYGTEFIKKLERVLLRGWFSEMEGVEDPLRPRFTVAYSDDGREFKTARALVKPNTATSVDWDSGLMARLKHRLFMLHFEGRVKADTRIKGFDSVVATEYGNEKLR